MQILVRSDAAELLDPNTFTSFDVAAPGLDMAAAVSALGADPCDEARHMFVPIDLVRSLAGDVGETWNEQFSAMLDYAAKNGWISDAGTHIKTHVVAE